MLKVTSLFNAIEFVAFASAAVSITYRPPDFLPLGMSYAGLRAGLAVGCWANCSAVLFGICEDVRLGFHMIEGCGLPGKEMPMHELAEEPLCYVEVLAGSLCWFDSMECRSVLASGTATAVVDAGHSD